MKKRIPVFMFLLIMMIFILTACGNNDSPREPGDPAKAMFITSSLAEASQQFSWNEFQKLAEDFNIEMTGVSGNNDASAEVTAIERAVAEGYDIIFINPTDAEAVIPALISARDADIIVGMFSTGLPRGHVSEDIIDFFCGSDDFLSAMMAGEYVSQQFPNGANIVEIRGPLSEPDHLHNGFIAGSADNLNVLSSRNIDDGWSVPEARQIMESFLNQYGDDIDIVWCHWDAGAYGVIEAALAAGRNDIFIIGVGGSSVGYDNIQSGYQQLSISRNYTNMVRQSLHNARALLDGGSVSHINIIPPDMITQETVSNFVRPEW